jgi:hypothetical protein
LTTDLNRANGWSIGTGSVRTAARGRLHGRYAYATWSWAGRASRPRRLGRGWSTSATCSSRRSSSAAGPGHFRRACIDRSSSSTSAGSRPASPISASRRGVADRPDGVIDGPRILISVTMARLHRENGGRGGRWILARRVPAGVGGRGRGGGGRVVRRPGDLSFEHLPGAVRGTRWGSPVLAGGDGVQSQVGVRMGRPFVDGNRVAAEFWTTMLVDGAETTLPGLPAARVRRR